MSGPVLVISSVNSGYRGGKYPELPDKILKTGPVARGRRLRGRKGARFQTHRCVVFIRARAEVVVPNEEIADVLGGIGTKAHLAPIGERSPTTHRGRSRPLRAMFLEFLRITSAEAARGAKRGARDSQLPAGAFEYSTDVTRGVRLGEEAPRTNAAIERAHINWAGCKI